MCADIQHRKYANTTVSIGNWDIPIVRLLRTVNWSFSRETFSQTALSAMKKPSGIFRKPLSRYL